jgi:hypothetical protein
MVVECHREKHMGKNASKMGMCIPCLAGTLKQWGHKKQEENKKHLISNLEHRHDEKMRQALSCDKDAGMAYVDIQAIVTEHGDCARGRALLTGKMQEYEAHGKRATMLRQTARHFLHLRNSMDARENHDEVVEAHELVLQQLGQSRSNPDHTGETIDQLQGFMDDMEDDRSALNDMLSQNTATSPEVEVPTDIYASVTALLESKGPAVHDEQQRSPQREHAPMTNSCGLPGTSYMHDPTYEVNQENGYNYKNAVSFGKMRDIRSDRNLYARIDTPLDAT